MADPMSSIVDGLAMSSGNGPGKLPHTESGKAEDSPFLDEILFRRAIALERERTGRSRKTMLLMLVSTGSRMQVDKCRTLLEGIRSALSISIRDTDVLGWYKSSTVVGVLFTEINVDEHGAILSTMMRRVCATVQDSVNLKRFSQLSISFHVFPEDWSQAVVANPVLYPDLSHRNRMRSFSLAIKRLMDIVGSLAAIVFFAPLFLLVAALVKLSSKGPILFKQERIGQLGKPFGFLKFRSMYANTNPTIHRDFMKRVIRGDHDKGSKMTSDPRITRIGSLLRKLSLDELPQFFNVIKGDMSLVGPRPPLGYECLEYDIWHRRRVLEFKPGITGLWQVMGRSRLRFDDMVRLDLQYVSSWSLWSDIRILLKTPPAVILGRDAF